MPQRADTRLSSLVHALSPLADSSFMEAVHGAFGIVGARFCSLLLVFLLGLAAVS